jgi:hypothetical protein
MNANEIRKFASDACEVISACQELIQEQAAEIAELKAMPKQASAHPAAAAPELDTALLSKAASAVHAVYGSPSNVTAEQIEAAWKAKPDYMLGVINKLASELINRQSASASDLGQVVVRKNASAEDARSADEIFKSKYATK